MARHIKFVAQCHESKYLASHTTWDRENREDYEAQLGNGRASATHERGAILISATHAPCLQCSRRDSGSSLLRVQRGRCAERRGIGAAGSRLSAPRPLPSPAVRTHIERKRLLHRARRTKARIRRRDHAPLPKAAHFLLVVRLQGPTPHDRVPLLRRRAAAPRIRHRTGAGPKEGTPPLSQAACESLRRHRRHRPSSCCPGQGTWVRVQRRPTLPQHAAPT